MKPRMRWTALGLVTLAVVGIVLLKSGRNKPDPATTSTQAEVKSGAICDSTMPCASPEELAAALGESPTKPMALPRMLELGSVGCRPCQMMEPILGELRRDYAGRLSVEFYDTRKDPEVGRQYKIRVIPTQIFLDAQGKEVFRHEGYFPKEEIMPILIQLGVAR